MRTRVFALAALLAVLLPARLSAIPAWSRKLKVECSMCHATPTWQLNQYGLEFLKSGHRTEPLKQDVNEQTLENFFSLIFKGRLISDSWDGARTGNAYTQRPKTQFELHSMSIYTGGPLSDRLSFFAEMYLNENTGSTSGSNIVQGDASRKKLAEAFLQYNLPVGTNEHNYLKFRAGEILPEVLHVFGVGARSAEQRAVVLNEALAGNANTFRPFSRQQGLDASFIAKRFDVSLGVVNGADVSTTNSLDADANKDVFATALVNLDKNASALGVYRYNGRFTNYATKQDYTTAIQFQNAFNRTGFLGRYVRDNWRLVGTYFMGEETVNAAGKVTKNSGYYALADYNFTDRLGAYVRLDKLDPSTDFGNNEVTMTMLGLNGLFFQSEKSGARWLVEYTMKDTYAGGGIGAAGTTKYSDRRLFVQLSWGF
jgi:hypothetical protein